MKTSDKSDKILPAFAKLLADIENPKKNAENPHFRNRYADLGAVIEAVHPHLENHGLSHCQNVGGEIVDGHVVPTVSTMFLHRESGQWIATDPLPLRPTKPDPQQAGSAITYGRRYSLMAALGMTAEDDDANKGSGRTSAPRKAPAKPRVDMTDAQVKKQVDTAKSMEALASIWRTMSPDQRNALQDYFAARKRELGDV